MHPSAAVHPPAALHSPAAVRPDAVVSPSAVCAALADPERLRVFAVISLEPGGVPVTGLQLAARGRKALARLLAAGLVQRAGDRYVVQSETFRRALEAARAAQPEGQPGGAARAVAGASDRVTALFSGGQLTSMPRRGKLRTELLRSLAGHFEPGRTYSEADVRRELEPVYDHAALRRYLVDEGLLERDNHGGYWRPASSAARPPG